SLSTAVKLCTNAPGIRACRPLRKPNPLPPQMRRGYARRMGNSNRQAQAATGSEAHSLRGILLFMLGLLLFACMDSTTKYLVQHYEAPLVVAVRYIVNALLMIILLTPTHGRKLVKTQRTGLVLVRAACLAG